MSDRDLIVPADTIKEALAERAERVRLVAFKTDFYALPQVAQNALYGLAALLEDAAAALAAVPAPGVSEHELRRRAEQAAASADDTTDPVTVGRTEWLALLDAIEVRS